MKKHKLMTPEQIAKIKELFAQGYTSYKIAKLLKIPSYVTKYHCDRVLLSRASTIPSPIQERIEMQEGLSAKQKNKILLEFITTYLSVQ